MLLRRSNRSQPRAEARGPFAPFGVPPPLSWALLAYAAVAVAAGSAFAVLRIHSDYLQVMQDEGDSLRGVTAALTSATQAMLDDGMGAARAAASEIRAAGGFDRLPGQGVGLALQRHLTGGTYVRSLFLVEAGHYVLAGRTHVFAGTGVPAYLSGLEGADEVWVGAPIRDPQDPAHWVVPIARPAQTGPGTSGWVGALLSFTSLEQLKQRFGDVVSLQGLVGMDGTILASVGDRRTGRSVAQSDLFQRAIAGGRRGGILEGEDPFSGRTVLCAYYPLRGYPIQVVAGQYRDAVLAGWRTRRRQLITATAAVSALVLILTAFLSHYMRALRTRERDFNTLVDSARFAVFLLEGDKFVAEVIAERLVDDAAVSSTGLRAALTRASRLLGP